VTDTTRATVIFVGLERYSVRRVIWGQLSHSKSSNGTIEWLDNHTKIQLRWEGQTYENKHQNSSCTFPSSWI